MKSFAIIARRSCAFLLFAAACVALPLPAAFAANHREAPLTALDHKADITDWFAFVSYDDPSKVTMILNTDPLLEPANGPNYHPFDPEVSYEMKVDNNFDGDEDLKVVFRFQTKSAHPAVFTGFVGAGNGIAAPANSPAPVPPGTPIVPPAITALDGPGSEGLSLRQTYTVTIQKKVGHCLANRSRAAHRSFTPCRPTSDRAPCRVTRPRTAGIYDLGGGIKVFAGTVDDPFYIDLGAAFDTLNFRASAFATGVPAVLSDDQDAVDDTVNFAPDAVAGYNVNSIAIELPISMLTSDGARHPAGDAKAVIGTYGSTSRPRIKAQPTTPGGKPSLSTNFVQIQRMGNPLINELLIGTGDKDKFSMSEPKNDSQFAATCSTRCSRACSTPPTAGAVAIPTPPRLDLLPLVTYTAPICPAALPHRPDPVADLLRLNTGIRPTPKAVRKRLGVLAGDFGGFPNGRRVSDDVTDIAARVVVGVLNPAFNVFPNNRIGDGVNSNDVPTRRPSPMWPSPTAAATAGTRTPAPPAASRLQPHRSVPMTLPDKLRPSPARAESSRPGDLGAHRQPGPGSSTLFACVRHAIPHRLARG
jgi:hypothetical protein